MACALTKDVKMSVDKLLESMTLEVYEKLRTAVELGKWESGVLRGEKR